MFLQKLKFATLAVLLAAAGASASALAVPPQTVKDSMSGNWAVINGKKLFLSGMNIAWLTSNSFGNDVGDTKINISAFTNHVKNIRKSGGNAVRWWLHTDASNCPKINANGEVTGLGSKTISNIREALDTAYAYGVVVDLCLFSFDMLVPGDGAGKASYSSYNLANNHKFLTVPANIDTYLNNALKPLLDSVGNHPAIMCWEVFNEPEGMLASANWSHVTQKITMTDILRITNKIAGFVHRNTKKMVSTGFASFQYASEYSTAKLVAAGGDADGYLDFYMGHYYPEWQDATLSPFHNPASHWNMDKPVLIGEFPAKGWSSSTTGPSSGQPLKTTKTIEDAFAYAYANGYAGAMSWAMSEQASAFFGDYSTTAPALKALYDAHTNDIKIKDVTIEAMSGNYVLSLTIANLAAPSGTTGYWELGTSLSKSFAGKTSLFFDIYVKPGSATNLRIIPVIKVTSSYTWSPATANAINLSTITPGQWQTVEIPLTAFGASSMTDVREILLQYFSQTTPYAAGTIYFDNVRVDNDTLANFNAEGSAWFTGASNASAGLVKYADATVSLGEAPFRAAMRAAPFAEWPRLGLSGRDLEVQIDRNSDTRITLINAQGAHMKSIDCKSLPIGRHTIALGPIAAGHYFVEMQKTSLGKAGLVSFTSLKVK
jgi:Glycosyl hydrolases family 2, TIM barrel domain